jgi:hypothetical protein
MNNELQDIIVTIDTREQNKERIRAVENWAIAHGAIVEHSKLELCDYRILGDFRGIPVNLGIEAKGLSDFCSCDHNDLKQKLFNSYKIYDDVALFIESGNYSFNHKGFGKNIIINPAVRDGSVDVCNLAFLEGCCSTLPQYGIHVRQLRSEAQFPYSIENLLTYVTSPQHKIIQPKSFVDCYTQTLLTFCSPAQVKKLIVSYPNLTWLCSASEESYKEIIGKVAGTKLYNFIRNHELETVAWKNGKFRDGTDKIIEVENKSPDALTSGQILKDKIKQGIVDYLTEKYPHALSVGELCSHFNIEQGDDDKEAFLVYLKELAWDKKITSTSSGLFQVVYNDKSAGGLFPKLPPLIIPPAPLLQSSSTEQQVEELHGNAQRTKANDDTKVGTPDNNSSHTGKESFTSPYHKPLPGDPQGFRSGSPGDKKQVDIIPPPATIFVPVPISEADNLFGKAHPDWIAEKKPGKMNLQGRLKMYLETPRTMQDCVDEFCRDNAFQKGTVYEIIMRMKREKVVIEFDNKTFVMKGSGM